MPNPRIPQWLSGEQAESLTRMKWAFLLMAGLSIYSMVGRGADYAKAPLSDIAWMIGVAVFAIFAVAASRREGVRVVGRYIQGVHGVRRVLVFAVTLWATVIASAHIARIAVDLVRDNTVTDMSYQFGVAGGPTTVFISATIVLFLVFAVLGRSALSTPEGVTRQHMRGADFASRESYLAELQKRHPARPLAAEIAGVPFPPGHERMHTGIAPFLWTAMGLV